MVTGKSKRERQSDLWIAGDSLHRTRGPPFYEKSNELLAQNGFESFGEGECTQC